MSALNAILLVGALSLLPRGLREAVSVKITEKTTVIKKKTTSPRTLQTHVVNLKRDAKDLSLDLQRLEVRGKLGSKTLYS